MAKKILITGAGGFIGGFIVEEALRRGYETWAAVRKTTNREFLQDSRIHFIELDFTDGHALKAALQQPPPIIMVLNFIFLLLPLQIDSIRTFLHTPWR